MSLMSSVYNLTVSVSKSCQKSWQSDDVRASDLLYVENSTEERSQ